MIVPADGEAEVNYTVRYRGSRRALIGYQARKAPATDAGAFRVRYQWQWLHQRG